MTPTPAARMGEDLLPCPFCGNPGEILAAVGEWWGHCHVCSASSSLWNSQAEAIAAWNRRSAPGWIACSERMPEDGQQTLIAYGTGPGSPFVSEDQYQNAKDRWGVFGDCPTHWMPLPTPPARSEGEGA